MVFGKCNVSATVRCGCEEGWQPVTDHASGCARHFYHGRQYSSVVICSVGMYSSRGDRVIYLTAPLPVSRVLQYLVMAAKEMAYAADQATTYYYTRLITWCRIYWQQGIRYRSTMRIYDPPKKAQTAPAGCLIDERLV